jgi:hypothetical protein
MARRIANARNRAPAKPAGRQSPLNSMFPVRFRLEARMLLADQLQVAEGAERSTRRVPILRLPAETEHDFRFPPADLTVPGAHETVVRGHPQVH